MGQVNKMDEKSQKWFKTFIDLFNKVSKPSKWWLMCGFLHGLYIGLYEDGENEFSSRSKAYKDKGDS